MKLIGATFCMAVICAAGLGAQSSESSTKTKITIKDGKDVTVTGCVQPSERRNGIHAHQRRRQDRRTAQLHARVG